MEAMTVKQFRDNLRPEVEKHMRECGMTPAVLSGMTLRGPAMYRAAYDGVAMGVGIVLERRDGLCAPVALGIARQVVGDVLARWAGVAPS